MTVNTLGSNEQDRSSRTVAEWLWPFLPMGISAFSLSALIWYHLRRDVFERDIHSALQLLYANLYKLIGFAPSVLFFLLTLTWSSIWFATGKVDRPLGRLGRLLAMTVMIGILINLGHGGVAHEVHKGELGAWFAEHLVGTFGYLASLLVVWAMTFASMLLATDFFFSDSFERLRAGRGGEVAGESGVEPAVTDHLRGLATVSPPSLPVEPLRPTPVVEAAAAATSGAATHVTEPAAEPLAIEEPSIEPPAEPRRRSYSERRRERERRWEQEEWVPPPPESQEIENAEALLRASEASASSVTDVTPPEAPGPVGIVAPQASAAAPATTDSTAGSDDAAAGGTDLVDLDELGDAIADDEEDDADEIDPAADDDAAGADADVEAVAPEVDDVRADRVHGDDAVPPSDEGAAAAATAWDAAASSADADTAGEDAASDAAVEGEPEDGDVETEPSDGSRVDEPAPTIIPLAATADNEPVVAIPRPETPAAWSRVVWRAPAPAEPPAAPPPVEIPPPASRPDPQPSAARDFVAGEGADERGAGRQQQLFGSWLDEGLIQDAIEVVTSTRRANATLLQRKLRIDYALAIDVLAALAARGVVALEGDATQGRVLV